MKRWIINLTLTAYIGAFCWGTLAHALGFGQSVHPAMYLFVWDMFCGWSYYERRQHVIGEGHSGDFYQLDPPPWGEFYPFGELARGHYDTGGVYGAKFAFNTLRHTDHEPISRIYVIEEYYAKKYNLPDFLWYRYYPEPKQPIKYYNVTHVVRTDGKIERSRGPWLAEQFARQMAANPRLIQESLNAQPFMQLRMSPAPLDASMPTHFYEGAGPIDSPLGQ